MTLEDVLAVYAGHPERRPIVRLHSGDPSLYGAIGEQIDWCLAHQRSWEIVPGVSLAGRRRRRPRPGAHRARREPRAWC